MFKAKVVSLKGLKKRSRGNYTLGEVLECHEEVCSSCGGKKCEICDYHGTQIVAKGKGIFGLDAVIPNGMVNL